MPDDQIADSSPAPSSPLSPSEALAQASPEALATWRNTGELPVETPSPAADSTPADAPAEMPADHAPTPQDAKPAASSPAKSKTDRNADTRKAELNAEIQELLQRRAQLRRELEAPPPPPQARADVKPAASSPAPDPSDPRPDKNDTEKYPDGQYDERYFEDLADWKARQVFRAEQEAAYTRHRELQAQHAAQERLRGWAERLDAAKAKYPDWEQRLAQVAIPEGSPIDVWVMDSPLGAELLLGPLTNLAEVRRIQALPVIQQVRELALLEKSLEPAPAKTITDAPDPPHTLGERTTTVGDPSERAVRSGDVAAFLAAENAKDMALRRASHR